MKLDILHINSNPHNSAITEYFVSVYKCFDGTLTQKVILKQNTEAGSRFDKEFKDRNSINLSIFSVFWSILMFRPKSVLCYGSFETTLCIFFKYLFFQKYKLIRFRGQVVFRPSKFKNIFIKLSHQLCNTTLFPSRFLCQNLEVNVGKIKNKKIVYLGRDDRKYYYDSHIPRSKILIVARFDPKKGHLFAAKCYSRFIQKYPNVRCSLCFLGLPTKIASEDLRSMVVQQSIDMNRFELLDHYVADLEKVMNSAIVGWIPSMESEYIARVAYEYLLCGVPIFVNSINSLPEALLFSNSGEVYNQRTETIDQIADRLYLMIKKSEAETTDDRFKRSQNAKRYFSLEAMKKGLNEIL